MPISVNPFVLAAVAVIAIGVVVYEIVTRQEQRKQTYRRHSPSSRRSSDDHKPMDISVHKPKPSSTEAKSSVFSSIPERPTTGSSENNLRERKRTKTIPNSHSSVDGRYGETKEPKGNENIGKNGNDKIHNLKPDACNQDIDKKFDQKNYEKNVLDKVTNDTKKEMIKNIDIDIDTSESKVINTEDYSQRCELSGKQQIESSEMFVPHSGSDASSTFGSETSFASIDTDSEKKYKEDVFDALGNDVENTDNENLENQNASLSGCNINRIQSDQSMDTSFCTESDICRGCEENSVNTIAIPCRHCYLCSDCAARIFRLYPKCSICHRNIERFENFKQ